MLQKIERETYTQVLRPRMLSGHLQGRLLSMFAKMIRPKTVLEIGTYTGYSALCLAEGLDPSGKLITIDVNEELRARVQSYFAQSDYDDNIDFMIGNALDIIPSLEDKFDLVFIDADKSNYWNYFELVIGQMNVGGYILVDNVLWSGKVLDEPDPKDLDTKALIDFNQKIQQDERVENVIVPFRDGITLLRVL